LGARVHSVDDIRRIGRVGRRRIGAAVGIWRFAISVGKRCVDCIDTEGDVALDTNVELAHRSVDFSARILGGIEPAAAADLAGVAIARSDVRGGVLVDECVADRSGVRAIGGAHIARRAID
jgi:hypothetical protein